MSKDKNPVAPIAIRFKQDLQLKGLGDRTQQAYCRALRKFTEFLQHQPDSATEDELGMAEHARHSHDKFGLRPYRLD